MARSIDPAYGALVAATAFAFASPAHAAPGGQRPAAGAPRPLDLGKRAVALAAADLDGDGRSELVTANPWDGTLSVVAAGAAPRHLAAPHGPVGVALGDVNHDGRIDLVVANERDFLVSVYLGAREGFSASVDHGPIPPRAMNHGWGVGLALADVNLDGHLDVAIGAGPWGGLASMAVLGGDGRGGFRHVGPGTRPPYDEDTFIVTSIAAGDLDGDGKVDLAVARVGGGPCVRRGNGNGTFGKCEALPALEPGDSFRSVAVADLDGDGRLELAATGDDDRDALVVFHRSAGGGLALRGVLLVNESPEQVIVADLDGDRRPDLLTVSTVEGNVAVARADGKGWYRQPVRVPLCTTWATVYRTDLSDRPLHRIGEAIALRKLEGYEGPEPDLRAGSALAPSVSGPVTVAPADLDGDGRLDRAVADPRGQRLVLQHATVATELTERLGAGCRSHPLVVPGARTSADGHVCTLLDPHERVVVRDREGGTEAVLNVLPSDPVPRGWTSQPDVSADGRFVVFASSSLLTPDAGATSAMAGAGPTHPVLYVHDRAAGTLSAVATGGGGLRPRAFEHRPRITRDGRHVLFIAEETCLAWHDRATGKTACIVGSGVEDFDVSADGRVLAWLSRDYLKVSIAEWSPERLPPRLLFEARRELSGAAAEQARTASALEHARKIFHVELDDRGATALLLSPNAARAAGRHAPRWALLVLDVATRKVKEIPYATAIGRPLVEPRFALDPAGGSVIVSDHPAYYRLDLDGKACGVSRDDVLCGRAVTTCLPVERGDPGELRDPVRDALQAAFPPGSGATAAPVEPPSAAAPRSDPGCVATASSGPVLARGAGICVTAARFRDELERYDARGRERAVSSPGARRGTLEGVIRLELLVAEARGRGLELDPDALSTLERTWRERGVTGARRAAEERRARDQGLARKLLSSVAVPPGPEPSEEEIPHRAGPGRVATVGRGDAGRHRGGAPARGARAGAPGARAAAAGRGARRD